MPKVEISWKRRTEDGVKVEVNVRRRGDDWEFYVRERRFENWEKVLEPPLEDWLELLDGVRRRVQRRLLRPEEEERVRQRILSRFPEADV
jgi:hypothetical protein